MVAFPEPDGSYDYELRKELTALRAYPRQSGKEDRAIPERTGGRLLLATWNIANLGVQKRRPKDYELIAEIIGWFDLVALQETNDDLTGLRGIQAQLPDRYRALFSDPGGNKERYAFLFDSERVELLEEVGRVTVPPRELPAVKLPGVARKFEGFDRNPYLASFRAGRLTFVLADVHLYFGAGGRAALERRCLEAFAIGRWADSRKDDEHAFTANVLALGDFNLPVRDAGDPVFAALTAKGLHLPPHSTQVGGSNLNDDAQYDQMAVFPGPMEEAIERSGVFDFDGALFRDLWGAGSEKEQKRFRAYVKYYLSDHRPLWTALSV
jgi:endonuclease/exonuclease/phosphatase family metal-dependent hydrolase